MHPVQRRRGRTLRVLQGVSFDIRRGELFGVVGRNGSGKSTLLRVLASIYDADAGTVKTAGRLAPFIELGVGFDQQLSASQNVMLNGAMLGVDRRTLRSRLDEVLEFAELTDFADVQLKNFSSGMRVRLAFAVMVQADPDIYLIDEILAVGDAAFQEKCLESFVSLKEQGKTIILVTHRQAVIERYADRALLLERGEILSIGAPSDVTRRYLDLVLERRATTPGGKVVDADHPTRGEITRMWVTSPDGADAGTLAGDSDLELHVEVEASGWIQGIGLRLELRNEQGVTIFAPGDAAVADDVSVAPGQRVTIGLSIENRLAPGRYELSAALLHSTAKSMRPVSSTHSISFEVEGRLRPSDGLVALRHRMWIAHSEARERATS